MNSGIENTVHWSRVFEQRLEDSDEIPEFNYIVMIFKFPPFWGGPSNFNDEKLYQLMCPTPHLYVFLAERFKMHSIPYPHEGTAFDFYIQNLLKLSKTFKNDRYVLKKP